jgi:electron transport complex protein RnfG
MMGTLGFAGLCSGLAVVGIFLITQPRIERNRAEALEAAIFRVLQGASSRAAFVAEGARLVRRPDANGAPGGQEVVYAGYDAAGALLGFAIPAEGPGFQDTIKLIYGFDANAGRIVGMEVLESRETPGLGDKIIKDAHFVDAFRNLGVDPEVVVVKAGRSRDNEVDAISGATISSKAVVRIINAANERWRDRISALPEGAGAAQEAE